MTRTLRPFVVVLLVAVALLGVTVSSAYADLEATPTPTLATSASNPGSGADAWWRQGWGNTLYPDFELNAPGAWDETLDGYLLGDIYAVDRDPATVIDYTNPQNYYTGTFPTGVNRGGTVIPDMLGIYMNPPAGGWPDPETGATSPLEGWWYYHYLFQSSARYQVGTPAPAGYGTTLWQFPWTFGFGVDMTPPGPVTGLNITTGLSNVPVTTWQPATRATISWDASETDALSGTGYYQVLINGKPFDPETSSTPTMGRVYSAPWEPTPSSVTIENMPPGAYQVGIQPVDRATNAGPVTSAWFYSDPDTPTISWTATGAVNIDPISRLISVNASDLAGDPTVTISLNGSNLATLTAPPYAITPDLSALAKGTYPLVATVKDHMNRTVTISKMITWDPTAFGAATPDPSLDVTTSPASAPDSADAFTGGSGWTNNLAPLIKLLPRPDGGATDVFYNIVQSPSDLDVTDLQGYYHSVDPGGTMLNLQADLKESIDAGVGSWAAGPTGSVAPYEGTWYFQWVWYNQADNGVSQTYRVRFNVDRTPPTAVQGFAANPAADTWTSSRRATFTWTNTQYDALSGDASYVISIDGNPAVSVSATSAYASSATIENMPAGRHKISISAVDYAGNVGAPSSLYYDCDPGTPAISLTSPSNPVLNPNNHTFSADATDDAGDPTVVYSLTGPASWSTTLTAAPYTITPDLTSLPDGAYTLSARAIDHMGHSAVVTQSVTWTSYDGSLDTTDTPGTSSNYYSGTWVNTLFPVVNLASVGGGISYNVVQTTSTLDPNAPSTYNHSTDGSGPLTQHIVDLKDTIDNGLGTWLPGPTGAVMPYEGTWYFQWKWHSGSQFSANTYRMRFDVDLTPPTAVSNFACTPAAGSWTAQRRAKFTWTNSQSYDALSGVNCYNFYIDDVKTAVIGATEPNPNQITIETMPAGKHKCSLSVVDNAGNEGPKSDLYFQSDYDTPTISFTSPSNPALNPNNHTLSVNATDLAGDPQVVFRLTGPSSWTTTLTASPYSVTPDLSALANGTYVLSATATDHMNRSVTVTQSVTWNSYDGSLDTTLPEPGTSPSYGTSTWINTLFPDAKLQAIGDGIIYNIVQTTATIDPNAPSTYYHSNQGYPLFDNIVDLKDTIDNGGPWLAGPAGSVAPYEGRWYFQWRYHSASGSISATTYAMPFDVDLTPPTAVANFTCTPAAGTWTAQHRAKFTWTNAQYDALSGVNHYNFYMDGSIVDTISVYDPVPNSLTIETMPAGDHKIAISAVDNAGNEGAKTTLDFMSCPDKPTLEFTEPTSTLTPKVHTISVDASDSAGDPSVIIQMSGGSLPTTVTLGTFSAPPYTVTPALQLMGLTDGTYTLRAVATDQLGRSTAITEDVQWDSSASLQQDPAVDIPAGQHIGTSSTNPGAADDAEAWWRQGWGNSLNPDFELTPPSPAAADYGFVVGMLYTVSTTPDDIDPSQPDLYYRAARGAGTNTSQTIDLQGVYNYPPSGGWRPIPIPGATSGIEGPWYFNLRWFTSMGYSGTMTYHVPVGIDLTPPSVVQSMVVSPSLNSADATSVIATTRVHISWAPLQYDALSGVGYYQIYIDGKAAVPDSPNNPPQGRVYNIPGAAPNSVTIENLSPGRHTISMAAVDRATNVGKQTTPVVIYSDPDTPTISIVSPKVSSTIGIHPTLQADASDAGGVVSVVYDVDGSVVATTTSSPYDAPVDLSRFSAGTHTLTATVTDRMGRKASDSRTFVLDKTPLILNSVKTSSTGRKVKVTFKVNRASNTAIYFSQTAATFTHDISSSSGGSYTYTYTYPKGRKYPSATSFYDTFMIAARDSVGNLVYYTGKVKVTLAKLVKVSKNKVKIIYY